MTTIAWDGRYLAADTMMVAGAYRCPGHVDKLMVRARRAFAYTGAFGYFEPMVRWVINSECHPHPIADRAEPPAYQLPQLIVVDGGRATMFEGTIPYAVPAAAPEAWGSGADFAIGAMLSGVNAMEAVLVAIKANPHTGGGVRYIDTQAASMAVQDWRTEADVPDCTGHLIDGNGCGICKRCERERQWHTGR